MRWIALLAVAGCYSPVPPAGTLCGPGGACPSGLVCTTAQTCELHDIDAATLPPPEAAPIDTSPLVDAAPDAPPGRWMIVQIATAPSSPATIRATLPGDVLVVALETNAPIDAVSDDGNGDSFVAIPAASSSASSAGLGAEIWYAVTSGGATTIDASGSGLSAIVVWEVSGLRTDMPLDVGASLDDQAATTTPVGPPVTTTAAGDFVVAVAIVANAVNNTHPGNEFTNDRSVKANGWAHLKSEIAPAGVHQAEWDQPSAGVYCSSAAAFLVAP